MSDGPASITFVTSRCRVHGQPEVTITFADGLLVPDSERLLLGHLEESVARGARFSAGQTLALGGQVLRFTARADGTLGLEEQVPAPTEQWIEAVDRSVREVMLQKFICESVGLPLTFPPPRASLLVARCAQDADAVTLTRVDAGDPKADLSGWQLSCAEEHQHDERFVLPVLALSALKPALVPFLALPPGTVVLVTPGPAHVFFEGEQRQPLPGSFLAKRNERAQRS
ncbi:MAG: hypothetical protein JNJ54_03045 [Myxococcaceae bacterium]|nr:hypothetical protein [Myxococcaceae bacterium]